MVNQHLLWLSLQIGNLIISVFCVVFMIVLWIVSESGEQNVEYLLESEPKMCGIGRVSRVECRVVCTLLSDLPISAKPTPDFTDLFNLKLLITSAFKVFIYFLKVVNSKDCISNPFYNFFFDGLYFVFISIITCA